MTARENTHVRLPPELRNELNRVAKERCVSVNLLIVKAIEDFLPRLVPVDHMAKDGDDGPRR